MRIEHECISENIYKNDTLDICFSIKNFNVSKNFDIK